MRHIPVAFELLGVLAVLYVLVVVFDAEATGVRPPSRPRARIPRLDPFRSPHFVPAWADMKAHGSPLDAAYVRWRAEFVSFEASCFRTVREFVRLRFDNLLDHYYAEGHESFNDFPAWAFERYLRAADRMGARGYARLAREVRTLLSDRRSDRRGRL